MLFRSTSSTDALDSLADRIGATEAWAHSKHNGSAPPNALLPHARISEWLTETQNPATAMEVIAFCILRQGGSSEYVKSIAEVLQIDMDGIAAGAVKDATKAAESKKKKEKS